MNSEAPFAFAPLSGLRVMVAEDYWHLADTLRLLLEGAGAEVAGLAATVADAEAMAVSHDLDAAIMDLDLQSENAGDLILRLAGRGLKVVIVTAHKVGPAIASKVHAVIAKPASAEALVAALLRPMRP